MLGGEQHGRRVGKPAAVVVAEVVQVEHDRRAAGAGAPHQLQADGVPAVGQQHVGPEPAEHLTGQVEEPFAVERVRCTLGPAGGRRHHRAAHDVAHDVNHLRGPAPPQRRMISDN